MKHCASLFAMCALLLAVVVPAKAVVGVFFSEYIEGTGNNKGLEIYNGTTNPVDLNGWTVQVFFNGGTTSATTVDLSGHILASGGVLTIGSTAADAAEILGATILTGSALFNGDDAVVLRDENDVTVDTIGQIGVDPGSSWGTPSTQNNTIRRKDGICQGDAIDDDAFDPNDEWDGFGEDVFDDFGQFVSDCVPVSNENPSWGTLKSDYQE